MTRKNQETENWSPQRKSDKGSFTLVTIAIWKKQSKFVVIRISTNNQYSRIIHQRIAKEMYRKETKIF